MIFVVSQPFSRSSILLSCFTDSIAIYSSYLHLIALLLQIFHHCRSHCLFLLFVDGSRASTKSVLMFTLVISSCPALCPGVSKYSLHKAVSSWVMFGAFLLLTMIILVVFSYSFSSCLGLPCPARFSAHFQFQFFFCGPSFLLSIKASCTHFLVFVSRGFYYFGIASIAIV